MTDKKNTTIRLTESTREVLRQATYVLSKSMSQIAEESLCEYFDRHGLFQQYQVTLTESNVVLLHLRGNNPPKVVDVAPRNGTSPDKIADDYATKLRYPVKLVVQGKDE